MPTSVGPVGSHLHPISRTIFSMRLMPACPERLVRVTSFLVRWSMAISVPRGSDMALMPLLWRISVDGNQKCSQIDDRSSERRFQAAKREGALLLQQRLRKGSDNLHSRRSRRTTLYLKTSSSRYDTAPRIHS